VSCLCLDFLFARRKLRLIKAIVTGTANISEYSKIPNVEGWVESGGGGVESGGEVESGGGGVESGGEVESGGGGVESGGEVESGGGGVESGEGAGEGVTCPTGIIKSGTIEEAMLRLSLSV
jgi:hypothetical protein